MRKTLLAILAMIITAGIVYAEIMRLSKIDTTTYTQTSAPDIATIAAISGQKNCIGNISIKVRMGEYILRILTGSTTDYSVSISTEQFHSQNWTDENAICGEINEALYVKMSTVTAGTFELNYSGFRY